MPFKIILLILLIIPNKFAYATESKKNQEKIKKEIIYQKSNWIAIKTKLGKKTICYAMTYRKKRFGNIKVVKGKKDIQPYLMINYTAKYKPKITFYTGYSLQPNSNVFASLDGKQFIINSYKEYAFADNFQTDIDFVEKLMSTKKVLVRANSSSYAYSIDEYDTTNFSAVDSVIKKKCKL
jgi:hypothetical protein